MKLLRFGLQVSALLYLAALGGVFLLLWPVSLMILPVIGVILITRKAHVTLTTLGSAHTASEWQIRQAGMFGNKGPIAGVLQTAGRVGFWEGVRALFSSVSDRDAVEMVAGKRGKRLEVVRMPQAVNCVYTASAGAGKSMGIVVPWLMSTDENAIILDYSGELALATAMARKKMGHEIVIFDPYHVVSN